MISCINNTIVVGNHSSFLRNISYVHVKHIAVVSASFQRATEWNNLAFLFYNDSEGSSHTPDPHIALNKKSWCISKYVCRKHYDDLNYAEKSLPEFAINMSSYVCFLYKLWGRILNIIFSWRAIRRLVSSIKLILIYIKNGNPKLKKNPLKSYHWFYYV